MCFVKVFKCITWSPKSLSSCLHLYKHTYKHTCVRTERMAEFLSVSVFIYSRKIVEHFLQAVAHTHYSVVSMHAPHHTFFSLSHFSLSICLSISFLLPLSRCHSHYLHSPLSSYSQCENDCKHSSVTVYYLSRRTSHAGKFFSLFIS